MNVEFRKLRTRAADAMLARVFALSLCVCVCVCVSHAGCVKTAKLMRLLFGTEAVLC